MFTDKTMAARKSKRINELIERSVKDELSALYQEPTKKATATSMLNLEEMGVGICGGGRDRRGAVSLAPASAQPHFGFWDPFAEFDFRVKSET